MVANFIMFAFGLRVVALSISLFLVPTNRVVSSFVVWVAHITPIDDNGFSINRRFAHSLSCLVPFPIS